MEAAKTRADKLDSQDPLAHLRDEFCLIDGGKVPYFCGNSLGLKPKLTDSFVQHELDTWAEQAVGGHFGEDGGWTRFNERFRAPLCDLLGCRPNEVVVMHSLTTNLHLLVYSFYKPTKIRNKIIIENKAFPSDDYAIVSQIALKGYDPEKCLVRFGDADGTFDLHELEEYLDSHGSEVALVWLGAVNYYSGLVHDIRGITEAAHRAGAMVGFDLAHAVGNVPLSLHDCQVDFAVFCTYKYLNAGPGSVGGAFVNDRLATNKSIPRMAGWWGNNPETRFQMNSTFEPTNSADGWQLSNAPVLAMATLMASLTVFQRVKFSLLRKKSLALTNFLFELLDEHPVPGIEAITPRNENSRGCQVSLRVTAGPEELQRIHTRLSKLGVVTDKRMPDVIRVAPVPLYNRFNDVLVLVERLRVAAGTEPLETFLQPEPPKPKPNRIGVIGATIAIALATVGAGFVLAKKLK